MVKKISQSFLKDCVEYFSGDLCGNIIKAKWIDDKLIDLDSKAARLGIYFEYQFTLLMTGKGSLPKDGKVPEKEMYANGKQPMAPYVLADANVLHLKDYFEGMGLKILRAGERITKGRFHGTIDLICECTKEVNGWAVGDKIVIDLKYSGLIDNRWEKFGWAGMLLPGAHIQKHYHGIQAKQYHMITGLPFYFLIVSPTNENDIELLHVPVTEVMTDDHIKGGNQLMEKFEFESTMGFEARPEISICNKCPLKGGCQDKHTYPHPKVVEL